MPLTIYAEFHPRGAATETVCVIGLGYIGLPTAAVLADGGYEVIGVDINPAIVNSLNAGRTHIVEPGLEELIKSVVASGGLKATTSVPKADVYLITVPTPLADGDVIAPDLSSVFAAGAAIAPQLRPGALVVLESTSPVGATRRLITAMAAARPDLRFPEVGCNEGEIDVDVVYSPERVVPGKTLSELASNARVIGGATPRGARRAASLYAGLTRGELLLTDDRSAEFVKLAENAFRDVNIAFANELSVVCDRLDLNVWDIIALANRHPRVDILKPGAGVGGHCIAVDPWFIVAQAPDDAKLIRAAREVNDAKPRFVIDKVCALMEANPGARIGCLGLAFKADVDDFRESPALGVAHELTSRYPGRVVCAEPYADALTNRGLLEVVSVSEALASEILVCLVAHKEFLNIEKPTGWVVDACGLWH